MCRWFQAVNFPKLSRKMNNCSPKYAYFFVIVLIRFPAEFPSGAPIELTSNKLLKYSSHIVLVCNLVCSAPQHEASIVTESLIFLWVDNQFILCIFHLPPGCAIQWMFNELPFLYVCANIAFCSKNLFCDVVWTSLFA